MSWLYNPFTGHLERVGGSLWQEISTSVSASSSLVVDSELNASFETIKYILTAFNSVNTAYLSSELKVLNNNGSYKETLSHKLKSSGLDIEINTNNNSGSFELIIVNNESFEVQLRLAKLLQV